jgi:hypothetical protein
MVSSWTLRLLAANFAFTGGLAGQSAPACWNGDFKTLVTFGDSYTDENRLGYFINNNGSAPPVGWDQPVVCELTSSFACTLVTRPSSDFYHVLRQA